MRPFGTLDRISAHGPIAHTTHEQYRFLRKISYGLDVLVAGILALETSDVIAAYQTSSPLTINPYVVSAGITALALRACTASMEFDLKYAMTILDRT